MDISKLLDQNPNQKINITVSLNDLHEFGESIAKTVIAKKEEKLYTRDEVIELFGVTRATLWRWTKHKIIKNKKVGRRVYYPESEIKRLTTLKDV